MKAWHEIRKFYAIVRLSHPHIAWLWIANGVFTALIPYISLYFSAEILNLLINETYEEAFQLVLLMSVLILLCSILSRLFQNQLEVIRRTATQGLDQKLLKKAMVMEYAALESQDALDTLRRTRNSMNGSGTIGDAVQRMSKCMVSLFKILFSLIIFIVLLIQIHTWDFYLFMMIASMILVLWVKNIFAKKHGHLLKDLCERNDRFNAIANYLLILYYQIDMAKEIRLYRMYPLFQSKMSEIVKNSCYSSYGKEDGKLYFYDHLIAQVLSFCSYVYVASLALRSIISIGQVLNISGVILQAVNAIADMQNDYAQVRQQMSYLNDFYDFMQMPNMQYDGTLPIEKRDDGEYEFTFHNVSFHYPGSVEDVLKNVTIQFRLKEKLAIVGMNGAGKTTIVKLLCRLYEPTQGEILLNGIDIKKYDYKEYTSIFSIVFQDFKLFSYALDQNIACAKECDEKRLWHCLDQVNMKEKVVSWKDQQKTLLYRQNGNGVNVSGGEAQKLAIARALYKDAPFVILDEPTAALDPLSEAEIYEHFDLLVKDKTTVYISHRMSSCKFCDRIIVMKDGCIAEEGTHDILLEKDGLYAELWKAQAKYYQSDVA